MLFQTKTDMTLYSCVCLFSFENREDDFELHVSFCKASHFTHKYEEAFWKLYTSCWGVLTAIMTFDTWTERVVSLVKREAADDGRYQTETWVIRFYTELPSSQKATNECVTNYIMHAEADITALINHKEALSDQLLTALILKGLPESF